MPESGEEHPAAARETVMPPQASKDGLIDVLRVGRDGVRFRFAAQLHLSEYGRTGPPATALPTLYQRIQATSQPTRVGGPWQDGIRVNDGTENGRPFTLREGRSLDDAWQRRGVFWLEGIPNLDLPEPDTIILDEQIELPFRWAMEVPIIDYVDPRGFLSIPYPQPEQTDTITYVGVNYFGEYTLAWTRPLQPGDWVAISFDRFQPPDRSSADYLAQVEDVNLFAPTV
jgi:hypothetical protein